MGLVLTSLLGILFLLLLGQPIWPLSTTTPLLVYMLTKHLLWKGFEQLVCLA